MNGPLIGCNVSHSNQTFMFKGKRKTLTNTQINFGSIDKVFPLLCPVREAKWIDGWSYKMIFSKSGLIEKDCVFTTPHHGNFDTVWQVTQYDTKRYIIEFLRHSPEQEIVKINIKLTKKDNYTTQTEIEYQYTSLNEERNEYYENELENEFSESMNWWKNAINHFLETGEMLQK